MAIRCTEEAVDGFEYELEFDPENATGDDVQPVYLYLRREGGDLLVLGYNAGEPVTDLSVIAGWCGVSLADLPAYLHLRYTEAWQESLDYARSDSPF